MPCTLRPLQHCSHLPNVMLAPALVAECVPQSLHRTVTAPHPAYPPACITLPAVSTLWYFFTFKAPYMRLVNQRRLVYGRWGACPPAGAECAGSAGRVRSPACHACCCSTAS